MYPQVRSYSECYASFSIAVTGAWIRCSSHFANRRNLSSGDTQNTHPSFEAFGSGIPSVLEVSTTECAQQFSRQCPKKMMIAWYLKTVVVPYKNTCYFWYAAAISLLRHNFISESLQLILQHGIVSAFFLRYLCMDSRLICNPLSALSRC
jgi:hypothetical protein